MVSKRGTVLMETVLVLPILTLFIFAIAQFALIWYAQIMTHYAAYNAARAALVYNPQEYSSGGVFKASSGPCWNAAVETLSWVASSPIREGRKNLVISGHREVPYSSQVKSQVRISSNSFEGGNDPVVFVRIDFDYPLYVPVIGQLLGSFIGGSNNLGVECITLHAHSILNKPWHTKTFPRAVFVELEGG